MEIRRALGIEPGDSLLFEPLRKDTARFRVVRQRPLTELAGALGAKRPYPGKVAVREEVGRALGTDLAERAAKKP